MRPGLGMGLVLAAGLLGGCGDDLPSVVMTASGSQTGGAIPTGTAGEATGGASSGGSDSDTEGTAGPPPGAQPWAPGVVYPTSDQPNARGLLDRRGPIHSHSVYSHDACDQMPMDGQGNIDEACLDDLRAALCATQHDFVMLTDHREFFASTAFPEVLLYRPDRGDVLVERNGRPVASWAACGAERRDAQPTLVLAGCEAATMPVGLERHAPGLGSTYDATTPAAIEELKATGAVSLVSNTEQWSVEQLTTLPLDGFEMYNLRANLLANVAAGQVLLEQIASGDPGLPHPDLVVFPLWQEDPRYLERWGTVLAGGHRRVTTLGTDARRNAFPQALPDGERLDSFRRMLLWLSNHLLVVPEADGGWDDQHLKEALRAGRLYGVFEYMGYASGFDAVAEAAGDVYEIGSDVPLSQRPEIIVSRPRVQRRDPETEAPQITMHVMKAVGGGFVEVAQGDDDELRFAPSEPGAYRVEVRIVPRHLAEALGDYAELASVPRVWIYANPFYVG